jgi:hypothetical protein
MRLPGLARAAPLLLGAVAGAIWMRRHASEQPGAARSAEAPPDVTPSPPPSMSAPKRQSSRFVRASERRSIDIVTVVDDLLDAGR